MRLLADENVSRLVIKRLRACGFEVISVTDTNPGAPDPTPTFSARQMLRAASWSPRIAISASW
jgi:hypothetical protein